MLKRSLQSGSRDGCGYLFLTCFFSCVFLVMNAALVNYSCHWIENWIPRFLSRDHVIQVILVIGPVAMVFVEWWLFDRLVARLARLMQERG